MNAVVVQQSTALAQVATASEMKAHVQRIQQVMRAVMKDGTHYGKIPGAGDRKSLFKAGAEVLCTAFHIAPTYKVEDMSDGDCVRYRVTCVGTHQATATILGEGMGEASSNEEKYKWRNVVCDEEFDEALDDRKRAKWQKGYQNAAPYQRKQIRTEPADIANTVLKMACKRAQVAMTINATAASDIFTQDLEDLPDEIRDSVTGDREPKGDAPRGKPQTQAPRSTNSAPAGGGVATEKQVKLIQVKLDNAGMSAQTLCERYKIDALVKLPFDKVNDALAFIADPERAAIQGE
jgi:hypothetical protein